VQFVEHPFAVSEIHDIKQQYLTTTFYWFQIWTELVAEVFVRFDVEKKQAAFDTPIELVFRLMLPFAARVPAVMSSYHLGNSKFKDAA